MEFQVEGMTMVLGELYFNHRILEDALKAERKRSEDYKEALDRATEELVVVKGMLSKANLRKLEGGNVNSN